MRRRIVESGKQVFGDAEIHQLHDAFVGDQNVRRLQIAMHDQKTVRILNGGAGLAEQFEAFVQSEVARRAIFVDGPRVADVLHHEIGLAVLGHAAIEQAADVGMLQVCQNLALVLEAAKYVVAVVAGTE